MTTVSEMDALLVALRQTGRELAAETGGAEDVDAEPHESSTSPPHSKGGET